MKLQSFPEIRSPLPCLIPQKLLQQPLRRKILPKIQNIPSALSRLVNMPIKVAWTVEILVAGILEVKIPEVKILAVEILVLEILVLQISVLEILAPEILVAETMTATTVDTTTAMETITAVAEAVAEVAAEVVEEVAEEVAVSARAVGSDDSGLKSKNKVVKLDFFECLSIYYKMNES
jgi:hypothetical protein